MRLGGPNRTGSRTTRPRFARPTHGAALALGLRLLHPRGAWRERRTVCGATGKRTQRPVTLAAARKYHPSCATGCARRRSTRAVGRSCGCCGVRTASREEREILRKAAPFFAAARL